MLLKARPSKKGVVSLKQPSRPHSGFPFSLLLLTDNESALIQQAVDLTC